MWDGDYVSGGRNVVHPKKAMCALSCIAFGMAFGFLMNWLTYGQIQHGEPLALSVGFSAIIMGLVSIPICDSIK